MTALKYVICIATPPTTPGRTVPPAGSGAAFFSTQQSPVRSVFSCTVARPGDGHGPPAGAQLATMKELVRYWATNCEWRRRRRS